MGWNEILNDGLAINAICHYWTGSPKEIIEHIKDKDPKISTALNEGYSADEILAHIAPPTTTMESLARGAGITQRTGLCRRSLSPDSCTVRNRSGRQFANAGQGTACGARQRSAFCGGTRKAQHAGHGA